MLCTLGVTVIRGDLTETAWLPAGVEGMDVVFHCAAKVGDWGAVDDYRVVNVDGLRDVCEGVGIDWLAVLPRLT